MSNSSAQQETCEQRDLARGGSAFVLWGIPIALIVVSTILLNTGRLPLTPSAVLWTIAVGWIGIGCLINARRCSRVHCLIMGTLFPFLAVIAITNLLGVVSFDWNNWWAAFLVILIASFVTERVWRPYYRV